MINHQEVLSNTCLLMRKLRTKKEMKNTIAKTEMDMISSEGVRKPIFVKIGQPYSISPNEAACPIAIAGLYPSISDIHGVDTFQALALAFEFVRTTIQAWEKEGYTFEFNQGEAPPSEIWFEKKKT